MSIGNKHMKFIMDFAIGLDNNWFNKYLYQNLPNKAMHRRPDQVNKPTPCSVASLPPPRLGFTHLIRPR